MSNYFQNSLLLIRAPPFCLWSGFSFERKTWRPAWLISLECCDFITDCGGKGSRTKKENLRGFVLWVLSYEPQGTGERSGPHYFIFPLLCNSSQWTFLLAYWSWIAEQRCFYIHTDKFKKKDVRLSRDNLMDYFCKLSQETEASCGSLIFHTPSHFFFFFQQSLWPPALLACDRHSWFSSH